MAKKHRNVRREMLLRNEDTATAHRGRQTGYVEQRLLCESWHRGGEHQRGRRRTEGEADPYASLRYSPWEISEEGQVREEIPRLGI